MRNAVLVSLHLDAFVGQNLTFSHQISVQLKTSEHFRAHFFVFRAQFLTKRRHFRPDPFLSCAERWRDLRAVHDSGAPCSERCPFLARYSRGVSSGGDLRGFSDTWHAYLAKISCIRIHAGEMLPRTGAFPVRGPFGNASGRYLAMAGSLGNASGRYLAIARRRMIATEVHRRTISDCNGDERAMFRTPIVLLTGLIAYISIMRLLSNLLIILRSVPTSTMKPAHKDAPRGNTEGKEEP